VPETTVRLIALSDSDVLADRYLADREFLRAWDAERPDAFFTPAGQRAAIQAVLDEYGQGRRWPGVIEHDGELAGKVSLNNILRGPLRSCFIGYWVARPLSGRGIATKAVRQTLDIAFHELGLHRVDAFANADNAGSCRVLEKNGFETVGISRRHIHIAGRWQDDVVFQKLAPWDDGVRLDPPPR
jgi:[ribosomal protein S5]-alanine N-acetyltransferase